MKLNDKDLTVWRSTVKESNIWVQHWAIITVSEEKGFKNQLKNAVTNLSKMVVKGFIHASITVVKN
jgi:hypothetical protein